MSRHFLPGCCRAVARRAPRGYRSASSGLKGLRPLRGGLRPPLTPETSGGPGRAAERAGPKGGCPERRGAPRAGDEDRKGTSREGGDEEILGKENKEGTRVNSCSITSPSENYKIILWLASG
jgi:hypothetical protein